MPIDDILREKNGGRLPGEVEPVDARREQARQNRQTQQNQQPQTGRGNGTLTIELPDPASGDREAMLFWMNVAQTVLLLIIAIRSL